MIQIFLRCAQSAAQNILVIDPSCSFNRILVIMYICVCSYIWAQKDCFLKRVRRFCITRAWASLLPGKKFKRLCFQKPGAEFLRSVVWKDQGSKMEIEWRGLDLRDWGGGKDWHGAGGCPLLIPAWLHDSEVPGSVVGGGIHYLT